MIIKNDAQYREYKEAMEVIIVRGETHVLGRSSSNIGRNDSNCLLDYNFQVKRLLEYFIVYLCRCCG